MWHKCDASFSEGFAQVRKDFKYGYIDKSDKLVIEIEPGTLKFPDWQSVMKYLRSKERLQYPIGFTALVLIYFRKEMKEIWLKNFLNPEL